jgi:hypothetical protein
VDRVLQRSHHGQKAGFSVSKQSKGLLAMTDALTSKERVRIALARRREGNLPSGNDSLEALLCDEIERVNNLMGARCADYIEEIWHLTSLASQRAEDLSVAWRTYFTFFGEEPHGTVKQMRAMLEFLPKKPPDETEEGICSK